MDSLPPAFFHRGPGLFARFAVVVLLSVGLMLVDARFKQLAPLRMALAAVLEPLQQVAVTPIIIAENVQRFAVTTASLQQENRALKTNQRELAAKLLRYQALAAENANLRALLDIRQRLHEKMVTAEIIYEGQDPLTRKVIINRGRMQGIEAGQAAIDSVGVIGQVTRVFPMSSEVTLLTDRDNAVPVQVLRTGMRAIIFGEGQDQLKLPYLATNADINKGDVLVTSGVDGVYPAGLPVAVVTRVDRNPAFPFAQVSCQPSAGVDRTRQLFILTGHHIPVIPEEVKHPVTETHKGKKGKKGKKGSKAEKAAKSAAGKPTPPAKPAAGKQPAPAARPAAPSAPPAAAAKPAAPANPPQAPTRPANLE
jgi:rod shape-determining protein MreC